MSKRLILSSLFLLLMPAAAHAGKKGNGACRADVERLCADAKGDRGAVKACLAENAAQLSAQCAAKIEKRKARHAKVQMACGADIQRLCAGAEGKALKQCLRSNRDGLSAECRAVAKKGRKGNKAGRKGRGHARLKAACQADAARLCADSKGKQRRQCMQAHRAELSAECSAAIEQKRARHAARKERRRDRRDDRHDDDLGRDD